MANSAPRLLFLSSSRGRGGAEGYMATVARAARQEGWNAVAAFPMVQATQPLASELESSGVATRELDVSEYGRRGRGPLGKLLIDLTNAVRTLRLLRAVRPDAVHITLPWPDYCFGTQLACILAGVPTVVVFQLVPPGFRVPRWRRPLFRWLQSRASSWIAISENNRRILSQAFGVDPEGLRVVYNGVAQFPTVEGGGRDHVRGWLREEFGLPTDSRVLVTVGRLADQKGYPILADCVARVHSEHPDVRFLWVGDGPLRADLEAMLAARGVRDRVKLAGHREDVPQLLQGSDLFVFPTLYEGGQSFAIAEAMSAGLPVVSSDASGIPEIIEHGKHGLLFPTGDAEALGDRVLEALADPPRMAAMAEQARLQVAEFSEEKMIDRTLGILADAAGAVPQEPEA